MGQRTTKPERRAARRSLARACRRWGTARTVRLMRGAEGDLVWLRRVLRLAEAVDVPPEVFSREGAGSYWGQYWPQTGEVCDAPYRPRLSEGFAEAMAEVCEGLARELLHPRLREIGVDPEGYTVGFELAGTELQLLSMPGPPLDYVPADEGLRAFGPQWEAGLPAGWGRS